MSRYVDIAPYKREGWRLIRERQDKNTNYVEGMDLDAIPAADVVEVVRCRDCKHRIVNKHFGEKGYLHLKSMCNLDTGDPFELGRNAWDDDWFCADGERKDGEQDDV